MAKLVFDELGVEIGHQSFGDTVVKAGLKQGLVIYEGYCGALLIQKFALRRVKLHILVARRYYTIEAAQLQYLPLHVLHRPTKIEYEVIPNHIRNFHTPLKCVSFCGCEYDIHLLIGKMILQKLLIFKAICGTCYHTDIHRLYQYLHCHDRMGV